MCALVGFQPETMRVLVTARCIDSLGFFCVKHLRLLVTEYHAQLQQIKPLDNGAALCHAAPMSNTKETKSVIVPDLSSTHMRIAAEIGASILYCEPRADLHQDLHSVRTAPGCVLLRNADKRGNVRVGVDQHRRIATGVCFQLQADQIVVVAQVRPNGECCELRQSHMLTRAGKTAEVEVHCTAVKGKDPGDGVQYAHGDVVGVAWLLGTAPVIPVPQKAKEKAADAEQKAEGAK